MIRYQTAKQPARMNALDTGDHFDRNWDYDSNHTGNIEVCEADEGEHWEDTGLIDLRGDPVWRITRQVHAPLGFHTPGDPR